MEEFSIDNMVCGGRILILGFCDFIFRWSVVLELVAKGEFDEYGLMFLNAVSKVNGMTVQRE